MRDDAASLFASLAENAGLSLSDRQKQQFQIYDRMLAEWGGKMNLTAIRTPRGVAEKHFLDSALLLRYYDPPRGAAVIDIGTGAGFPGVPLKILRPDLKLTLLDSLQKRLVFLSALLKTLGIHAEIVHARAEEAARQKKYRLNYDFVTARAVAAMPVLCEYCLPFLARGGVFAAMKGPNAEKEMQAAMDAVKILGCSYLREVSYFLPSGDGRSLFLIRRTDSLSSLYPRHGSKILKNPLHQTKPK